jgi:hypothetical protein
VNAIKVIFKAALTLTLILALELPCAAHGNKLKQPEQSWSKPTLEYWISKNLAVDVDEDLKELGIEAAACTYHSGTSGKDISFKGLGPCLHLNFKESMETDQLSGVTYFWLKGLSAQSRPLELSWRPPQGGMRMFFKQVFEMNFENELYWLRSHIGDKKSAENLHYKEFLAGNWELILPDDTEVRAALISQNSAWLSTYLKKIEDRHGLELHKLRLNLLPTERENGVAVHTGLLQAELQSLKTEPNQSSENLFFSIKTNLNIILSERRSYFKIHSVEKLENSEVLKGEFHAP